MLSRFLKVFCVLVAMVAVCIWTGTAAAQIVRDGLVSYWTFDKEDMDDDTAKDVFGNNDGTIGGNPGVVEGKIGDALEFDGDDYVDCGDIDMEDWTDISVSAWISTAVDAGNVRIAAKDQGGIPGNWIFWHTADLWQFAVYDGGGWVRASTDESLGDEDWHHIVGTVDNTNDKVNLYVDGELVGSADFAADTLDDSDAEIVTIGADSDIVDAKVHLFIGVIDEFSLYKKALSADEVKQNFTSQSNTLAVVDATAKLIEVWGRIKISTYNE